MLKKEVCLVVSNVNFGVLTILRVVLKFLKGHLSVLTESLVSYDCSITHLGTLLKVQFVIMST